MKFWKVRREPGEVGREPSLDAVLFDALNSIFDQQAIPPLFSGISGTTIRSSAGDPIFAHACRPETSVTPVTLLRYCPDTAPACARGCAQASAATSHPRFAKYYSTRIQTITVSDDDESRRVEAKDIFILTRTGAEAVEIGGYLREQGVPFAFYKKDGLFQTSRGL